MSRLFTELYIYEDVSAPLTKLLRSLGFVVTFNSRGRNQGRIARLEDKVKLSF